MIVEDETDIFLDNFNFTGGCSYNTKPVISIEAEIITVFWGDLIELDTNIFETLLKVLIDL
jgi:hypothetical protein